MDVLHAMGVFLQVARLGSFTRAAEALRLSKGTVTVSVKQLEEHLSTRLFHRTTRRVQLTADGAAYLPRAERLLQDLQELESSVRGATTSPAGRLRVDVPGVFARHVLAPALPRFFARYPGIVLEVGSSDRPVDLIRENVDCVVRGGAAVDETLIARPLGVLPLITCAAPSYLARFGRPRSPEALSGHRGVRFMSPRTGAVEPFELERGGEVLSIPIEHSVTCSDSGTLIACGLAGVGLIQVPLSGLIREHLDAGRLVRVLEDWDVGELPFAVLYPTSRHLSARVRAFVDWITEEYRRELRPPSRRGPERGGTPAKRRRTRQAKLR